MHAAQQKRMAALPMKADSTCQRADVAGRWVVSVMNQRQLLRVALWRTSAHMASDRGLCQHKARGLLIGELPSGRMPLPILADGEAAFAAPGATLWSLLGIGLPTAAIAQMGERQTEDL